MKKLKIMTIYGTRPEIIRLSEIMRRLDKAVEHIPIHTGQSYDYEMSKVFFEDMEVREPVAFLGVKSSSVGEQISKIIAMSEMVLIQHQPDALLVLGDTNSVLAAVIAKRMKIPIFHLEAGNRCFNDETPEEINRRIVDHISNVNLCYSENSRLNLLREGIHPKYTFVTGSPMREVITANMKGIEKSKILEKLKLKEKGYFVVSFHREENVETKRLNKFIEAIEAIADRYKLPIIVTTHHRTKQNIGDYKHPLVSFCKPFGYHDYMKLQMNAFCVISDSGTIPEDAGILNFPAIQAREANERPEAYDEGALILSGFDTDIILQAIDTVTNNQNFGIPKDYQPLNVSEKVVRHIIGLTKLL